MTSIGKKEIDWVEKLDGIFFKKVITPYKGEKHIEFKYLFSNVEDVNKKLSKVIKETIEEMLWIPCCHLTGEHNPEHYKDRKYICRRQKAQALERFCEEMAINPQTKSLKDCFWCNTYPEHKKGEGLKLGEQGNDRDYDELICACLGVLVVIGIIGLF